MPEYNQEVKLELEYLESLREKLHRNLLVIEERIAEFVDPRVVPLDLLNAQEVSRSRLAEIERKIEAITTTNAAVASIDSLTASVKDDVAAIREALADPEQVVVLEEQITALTEAYRQVVRDLKATSLVSGIEPRLSVLQPNVKLVDANLAYKYATFQDDTNVLLGFATLFLGVGIGEATSLGVSISSNADGVVVAIHATVTIISLLVTSIFGYLTRRAKQKADEAKEQIETDAGVKEVLLRSIYIS